MSAARITGPGPTSTSVQALSRPQVQSRRVSLKLGPLGLTYATDEVLWPDEPGAGAASSTASAATTTTTTTTTTDAGQNPAASATSAQNAPAESFSQELLAAWRRQAETLAQATRGYDATGRLASQATSQAAPQTSAQSSTQASAQASAQTGEQTGRRATLPAMRRAIAAYLLRAADSGPPGSMISAVA